ncbi:3-oxoacyl-ACP synthase III family protein [Frankia sp. CNm7]|uniref:3-oxoacyl-ACP synthase III family protein n=1 Tax=Frankia nepalensis TaxID=1836974 RepID=A0A937RQS7_9ACTN|nr:3-oxoacyl-ACP synthase III family protein [Frankia nepalensis]MBL7497603.1 3-oxoacyl-ACP synthase III family protein [Frankia nepalensis]MBL7511789.1 3-oxoacyl-ACP synthase III family protein [Frankia nepalensis]MBL7518600.1 3-oxoacyl-ACP synthase III family protein [Frankia nepalensis]MBL7633265.1 3-oxoacyl-ACP synthase III family protein [Frankia nepalensis]
MSGREVQLRSVGTALPGPAIDNATLARRFGVGEVWEQWVEAFLGTRTRHLSVDLFTGEVDGWLADLGALAGQRALAAAGVAPGEVDLIVLATSSPDQLMPATVNVIADRLGIDEIPSFQLQSGCSGALQALDLARQLLLGGRHRTALVLGGDVSAKQWDLTADPRTVPQAQLVNAAMFGDGVGAAVLGVDAEPGTQPGTQPGAGSVVLREVRVRLGGLGRPSGHVVEWFGVADRHRLGPGVDEDYKAIEQLVPGLAEQVLDELLHDVGWKRSDVDYLLPPQLSGRMTAKIVETLAVQGAVEVTVVPDVGNTGNALPFFQLERLLPRLSPGDRAVALAIESSKWIRSAFALEKVAAP